MHQEINMIYAYCCWR